MLLAIDCSGSMQPFTTEMKQELEKFKKGITESKEANKILVSRLDFSTDLKFAGYKTIAEFDVNYSTVDMTALFDAIVEGAAKLLDYMEYLKKGGERVKAVFAIFSDGQDNHSKNNMTRAIQTIETLNSKEIVTAFVSFGSAAEGIADDLQIKNKLTVGKSVSDLRKAFNQLSKSIVQQSKSVKPKTDDFFEN